ncbi:MAG TPA: hypothetical protein QF665_05220 [Alphaproteobacteria bacterium]|nr:hypothetical protein [Alphaproteobacteria bacterium]
MASARLHFRSAPVLALLLLLAACATPYGPPGIFGGVSHSQTGPQTFYIEAYGNAYTSVATIESYLYRRAAEIARGEGYDYFAFEFFNAWSETVEDYHPGYERTTTTYSGSAKEGNLTSESRTEYVPGYSTWSEKPRGEARMRLIRSPGDAKGRVYDAEDY